MKEIELSQTPSQNFTVNLNDYNFDITLRDIGGLIIMDVSVNGALLAAGLAVLPNQPVFWYAPLTKYGNFVLLTESEDYPTYKTIGKDSSFYYMTPQEAQEIANA